MHDLFSCGLEVMPVLARGVLSSFSRMVWKHRDGTERLFEIQMIIISDLSVRDTHEMTLVERMRPWNMSLKTAEITYCFGRVALLSSFPPKKRVNAR